MDREALAILAEEIAKDAHLNQKYGEHPYFEYHVLGVTNKVIDYCLEDSENKSIDLWEGLSEEEFYAVLAALLHDVVEDSAFTLQDLLEHGIPNKVVEAVGSLTKGANETRFEYIIRVRKNPVAKLVKIADSTFNLEECKKNNDLNRASKYEANLKQLVFS